MVVLDAMLVLAAAPSRRKVQCGRPQNPSLQDHETSCGPFCDGSKLQDLQNIFLEQIDFQKSMNSLSPWLHSLLALPSVDASDVARETVLYKYIGDREVTCVRPVVGDVICERNEITGDVIGERSDVTDDVTGERSDGMSDHVFSDTIQEKGVGKSFQFSHSTVPVSDFLKRINKFTSCSFCFHCAGNQCKLCILCTYLPMYLFLFNLKILNFKTFLSDFINFVTEVVFGAVYTALG